MNNESEWLKWQLEELAGQDDVDIESNELEIIGENEQGQEGYCTVKITDIAQKALDRIKGLELDLGLANVALQQKTDLLESCEKALAERNESIMAVTDEIKQLKFELLMMAKAAADEPMFFNPLDAAQAIRIRDRVLESA